MYTSRQYASALTYLISHQTTGMPRITFAMQNIEHELTHIDQAPLYLLVPRLLALVFWDQSPAEWS